MMPTPQTTLSVDEIKLSDPAFWVRTDREKQSS